MAQHEEVPHELDSEDDGPRQHHDDHEEVMMEYAHAGHPHHPDMSHHEGDDLELRSVNTVNDVGAELGLNALRDSPEGVKPFYPYSTLIREFSIQADTG